MPALQEPQLSDCPTVEVSIQSSWHSLRAATSEATCQATSHTSRREAASQAVEHSNAASQTEGRTVSYLEAVKRGSANDPARLAAFLRVVGPRMRAQLAAPPVPRFGEAEEEGPAAVDRALELRLEGRDGRGNPHRLCCTALSWSATGQSLAASYGRHDITGWCTTPGALASWHVGRDGFDPAARPDARIDTPACLQCCSYHPRHPALIAGGSFNGELMVWDLGREGDAQLGRSRASEASHEEPIMQLAWVYSLAEAARHSNRDEAYQIVTLGAEGRLLVWLWQHAQDPIYGYELLHRGPGSEVPIVWSGTRLAFPDGSGGARVVSNGGSSSGAGPAAEESAVFLVGTGGGAIFKCSLEHNDMSVAAFAEALARGARPPLRPPVRGDFPRHAGPVTALHCSPFAPHLFLSAGTDGRLRLASLLQRAPLAELEPSPAYLHCAAWSPARPLVLAAGAGDGRLYIYDLEQTIQAAILAVPVCSPAAPVHALAFNAANPAYLATGDPQSVKVWALSPRLSKPRSNEARILSRMTALVTSGERDIRQAFESVHA